MPVALMTARSFGCNSRSTRSVTRAATHDDTRSLKLLLLTTFDRCRLCQESQIPFPSRHAHAVEILAQRHRVLSRRAEQIPNLRDSQSGFRASELFGDQPAHLGFRV